MTSDSPLGLGRRWSRTARIVASDRRKLRNDLVASVSAVVTGVDADLEVRPGRVTTDPCGAGWLRDVRLDHERAGVADLPSRAPRSAR